MPKHDADLEFPNCCSYCPYQDEVTASCNHNLRQSLIKVLDTDNSCPIYTQTKTRAMQQKIKSF
ncbi:MAG: hypothetical protein ABEI06_02845 [Halobacteriaceae archaeon]